jgi:hypothetical protein
VSPRHRDLGKSFTLKNIDAKFNAGDPTSAATGELRFLAPAAPALPVSDWHQGIATFSDQVLAGVGRTGRSSYTRPAANPVNAQQ